MEVFLVKHISKNSLDITFEVLSMQTPFSSISKIFKPFLEVTVDIVHKIDNARTLIVEGICQLILVTAS